MSGKVRLGIVVASVCGTIALIWAGTNLAMLSTRWFGEHPNAAKYIQLFLLTLLPIIAIVFHRRRGRATVSV